MYWSRAVFVEKGPCTLSSMFCPLVLTFLAGKLLLPSKRMYFGICWSRAGEGMIVFDFVGQVMVKSANKGPKERC